MAEDELEARILKKLYVWLVLGGVAIGGVGGTGVLRINKFTGSDAELMKFQITSEYVQYVSQFRRPPTATRIRIEALEKVMKEIHPDYQPPTDEW